MNRLLSRANVLSIGSFTALRPYAHERYLANHTMLSVCDKLHKIYGAQAPPVVWARTVGVEVLNELDTVKAALVRAAGSERRSRGEEDQLGWEVAAKGVQDFAKGMDGIRMVGGMVGAGLTYMLQRGFDTLQERAGGGPQRRRM